MAWLGTYAKRISPTINYSGKIETANQTDFPVLIYISAACGVGDAYDASCVFDELESDDNKLKIAVTLGETTECSVEIEKWDDANEQAWLWVKVPSVSYEADTPLYLYYDKNHAASTKDNSAGNKVGLCADGSAATHAVWDANFKMVQHLAETGGDETARVDSTSEDSDLTMHDITDPSVAGKIGVADDFEAANTDYADRGDDATLDLGTYTLEAWVKPESHTAHGTITEKREGAENDYYCNWNVQLRNTGAILFFHSDGAANNATTVLTTVLSDGTWYYLAGVYDAANDDFILYKDAAVADSDLNEAVDPYTGGVQTTKLGRGSDLNAYYFDGIIDEFRISSNARSAAWLKASYYSGDDNLLTWGSEETGAQAYEKSLYDTLTMTDSLTSKAIGKALIDTLNLTGSVVKNIVKAPFTETLNLVDIPITIVSGIARTFTEVMNLVEATVSITKTLSLTLTETIKLTGTKTLATAKTLTETLKLTGTKVSSVGKTFTEAVSLVESAVTKSITKTVTEALNLVEATVTIGQTLSRTYTEVLSLTSSVSKAIVKAALTEVLYLTDTVTRAIEKTLTETLNLVEGTIVKAIEKTIIETLHLVDIAVKIGGGLTKLFTETIGLTDTVIKGTEKTLTDAISLVEGAITKAIAKTILNTIQVFDSYVRILDEYGHMVFRVVTEYGSRRISKLDEYGRANFSTWYTTMTKGITKAPLVETLNLVDISVTRVVGIARTFTETLNLVEGAITKGITKTITEVISLTDIARRGYTQLLTETISLVEATVTKATAKVLTEVISLTDTFSKSLQAFRTFTETINLTDVARRAYVLLLTETISLVEATVTKAITKVLTEVVSLTDTFSRLLQASRAFTETIKLTDAARRAYEQLLTETISLAEATITKSITKVLTETISLADSVVLSLLRARDLTVKVFTAQYRKLTVFTSQYRKLTTFTAQYRKLAVFTAQYRKITTLTSQWRKLKIFTFGGQK